MTNRKQVRAKLLEHFTKKPELRQPGRVEAHLMNELKLPSKDHIYDVLIELEKDGLVTLDRAGHVINGVTRTSRQRAKSLRIKVRDGVVPAAPVFMPAAVSTPPAAKTPVVAATQPVATKSAAPAEAPKPKLDGVKLVERLTAAAEKLEADLAAAQAALEDEKTAHLETKGLVSDLRNTNDASSRDYAAAQLALEGKDKEIARLKSDLTDASKLLDEVGDEMTALKAENDQLRGEASIESLAERVSHFIA